MTLVHVGVEKSIKYVAENRIKNMMYSVRAVIDHKGL